MGQTCQPIPLTITTEATIHLSIESSEGSSVDVEPLTVTENGTYTASAGKAYSPVIVKVPQYLGHLTFGNIAYLSVTDPVWNGTMYISDDAEQWSTWDGTRFEPGDSHTIYLRGSGNTRVSNEGHSFAFDAYDSNEGGVTCEGNIETLLDAATVARGEHPAMASYGCYRNMFQGCTSLTTAPVLPATTLRDSCYENMFQGCTSLTTAPELPATTLADYCYHAMFQDCTSLTTAPTLPATTLVSACYHSMFRDCTSLTTAPALPATTLANQCYAFMFAGCTSLIAAPALPATTLANYCYREMFRDCTSLVTAPSLPATTLADHCCWCMFQNCTSLTTAPALSATTLADSCYQNMFYGCAKLATLPALPATTLADCCYYYMFCGCTLIKLSATNTGEYTTPYRIPVQGRGTTATAALANMFRSTGGTFTETPVIDTTYYTSNTVV